MSKWLQKYRSLSGELKLFLITFLLFMVATIGTTIYCYTRVLSAPKNNSTASQNQ